MSGILSRTKSGSGGAANGGSQTQTGDAFNISASAGDDQSIKVSQTYNNMVADFGAVEGALSLGVDALDYASEMGDAAISASTEVSLAALGEVSGLADSAIYSNEKVTTDALGTVLDSNRMAQQTVLQALDYNQALIAEDRQTEATTIFRQLLDALPIVLVIGGVVYVAVKSKGK